MESKPREFFLADSHIFTESGQEFRVAATFPKDGKITGKYIHVIEVSAVEKLQLENTVLKEKLEIAESKIEELQSQVAYCENP